MARKRYAPEGTIGHLRRVELESGQGTAISDACRKLGITEQTSSGPCLAYWPGDPAIPARSVSPQSSSIDPLMRQPCRKPMVQAVRPKISNGM